MKLSTMAMSVTLLAAGLFPAAAHAAKGESWKAAGSLAKTPKAYTLVAERNLDWEKGDDPDDLYYDDGVYYFKIACAKGRKYSVWTSGLGENDEVRVDISPLGSYSGVEKQDAWTSFDDIGSDYNYRGADYYYYLSEWDDDDPKTVTYIVCVEGPIGKSVTIAFAEGMTVPPKTWGRDDTPKTITVSTAVQKETGKITDEDAYNFTAELVGGAKYKFWTSGGTEELPLTLSGSAEADEDSANPSERELTVDVSPNDQGWIIVPEEKGKYRILVAGEEGQAFTLNYGMIGTRKPASHAAADAGSVTAAGYADAACAPGRRNDPQSGYFDNVIDETLYKVKLAKGAVYSFATEGAAVPLVMELYDSKGDVLASCRGGTTRSDFDCALSYECTTAGDYWVGVCEDLADDEEDEPSGKSVRFSAKMLTPGEDGLVDEWDAADDTYVGASGLAPGMGEFTEHGPHTLGAADFADYFRIDARNGLSYELKSVLDETSETFDARMTNVTLSAGVYTLSGSSLKEFSTIAELSEGGSFKAAANASYYVMVTASGTPGQDYGPYTVLSKATGASGLGALTVDIGGATVAEGATWQITAPVPKGVSEPKYPGGASIYLAAGTYTIAFSKVSNWTQPANVSVAVVAGETKTLPVKYCDVYDVPGSDATAGDGAMTGKKVTALSKAQTFGRSLWHDDAADWYKLPVSANVYYSLALSGQGLGDATLAVYRENGQDVVARGASVEFLCREAKANYYVCVSHATEAAADSQYTLAYSSMDVGGISFKGDVSVKDSAPSASLVVKRSGKDAKGRVRVRYSTFAGTAKPGVNYEPQSGYLEWAEGDKKDKTLQVALIPDLVDRWEADRSFTVRLATVPSDDLEDDEVVPGLDSPFVATVTITESAKKTTGTVSLVGYGSGCEAFADPKKPAVAMPAGESLELWLERADGSDGRVAVTVTPTKGTAAEGTHFDAEPATVVWEHGETGAKPFTLKTFATDEAYMAAKTLTVKVAADKTVSSDTAKIGVGSASVTLRDPKVTKTAEEYSAGFGKSDGIAVKACKTDTWYFNEIGDLVAVTPAEGGKAELTVTLAGPGRFTCAPTFLAPDGTKSACTVTIGKEVVTLVPGEETEIKRFLGKGSTTVKIALSRTKPQRNYDVDDSEISVSFADQGGGAPFGWKALPTPSLVSPLAGEVTLTGSCLSDEHGLVKFEWSDAEDPEIVYLFSLDADKKNVGTAKAKFQPEALDESRKLIPVYCDDCVDGEVPGELASEKTYWWRVDTTFADEDCTVTNVNSSVWQMTPMECEDAPYAVVSGGTDAYGNEISAIEKVGSVIPVPLLQGISTSIDLAGKQEDAGGDITTLDGATFAVVKGSSLPAGLSLKGGRITGAPSKPGSYTTIIQASYKAPKAKAATAGGTITFGFEVAPIGLAEGTFSGVVQTEDERLVADDDGNLPADAVSQLGSVSVTAAGTGKISAKLSIGGASYSYSANGWNGTTVLDNGKLAVWSEITNVVKLSTKKTSTAPAATVTTTNVLRLVACCADASDREALDTPMAVSLVQSFLGLSKESVFDGVAYEGVAYRDNRKVDGFASDMAAFAGYYTISLAPQSDVEFNSGYGYLTLTVDSKGGVKMAGVLADGSTKPSASSAAYVSESSVNGRPELVVPVSYGKGTVAFGGTIVVCLDEDDRPYVSATSRLCWINADPASTYGGEEGFSMGIEPVGGWYSTVYNLQAYYLNYDFVVKAVDPEMDLPEELLGSHEAYVCWPGMFSEYLSVVGNSITAPKQALAYRETLVNGKKTKLVDWEGSVNPANVTFSFKQATGIYSGKFDLYAGDSFDDDGLETKQTKLGSFSHQGILVMNRDRESGALAFDDAVMPGFYLVPVKVPVEGSSKTRSFTASLPFVIAPEERVNEWDVPGWAESLP